MSSVEEKVNNYRQDVERFEIIDTALWWAPEYVETFKVYDDAEQLFTDHKGYGINRGILTTRNAAFGDYLEGTQEAVDLIKDMDNYYACTVLVPEVFYDPQEGADYLKKLKNSGVVAARIYPGTFNFTPKEFAIGPMCEALEALDMPLVVWHIDTTWDKIDEICTNHPKLKVVVESMDRKLLYHQRDYISLMKKHENLYMENHNLVLFNEYDVIDKYCGPYHLMYGSYFPYMNPDFSIYPVLSSGLTDDKKQLIFSGNAKRVFNIG